MPATKTNPSGYPSPSADHSLHTNDELAWPGRPFRPGITVLHRYQFCISKSKGTLRSQCYQGYDESCKDTEYSNLVQVRHEPIEVADGQAGNPCDYDVGHEHLPRLRAEIWMFQRVPTMVSLQLDVVLKAAHIWTMVFDCSAWRQLLTM